MKTYIVGNWKMNFTVGESSVYLHKLLQQVKPYRDIEVVVLPSTIALQPLSLQTDRKKVRLGGQYADAHDFGSFTGATSCMQLRGIADYVMIGHGERRQMFGETDRNVQKTVAAAVRNQLKPILCVGETETERVFGETEDIVRDQVLGGLADVSEEDLDKVILAYAPVWALSTASGAHFASPEEVANTVDFIRSLIADTYGKKVAENIPILFGGSVNPQNAGAYLTIPGVNGVLVGNSSLIAEQFINIIETAKRVRD